MAIATVMGLIANCENHYLVQNMKRKPVKSKPSLTKPILFINN
jgi:hypothetical protein